MAEDRRGLERKKIMAEFVRPWQERERQNAEDEIAKVKVFLEEVEETTEAPIYVPETLRKAKNKLKGAEESLIVKDYYEAVNLASEIRELLAKAIDCTRAIIGEKEKGRYLYGVIPYDDEKSFGFIGLHRREVYTIPFRDVSAVVSSSSMKEYELTEENAMKHQEVIRQIMDEHTVIPTEFGTVIQDETIMKNLMAKSYNAVKECTKLIDGKVELGLKAVLKREQSLTPIEKKEVAQDMLDSLREQAEQTVAGSLFSNRLVLNASFLVEKTLVDQFSQEIEGLQEKYADKLDLLYSGPWAPHNFVYIKIGADGISFKRK